MSKSGGESSPAAAAAASIERPDFTAPRKCKDIFCCTVFSLFWVAMIGVAIAGFVMGNPGRLVYAVDHRGEICGVGDLSSRPRIAYPRLAEDVLVSVAGGGFNVRDPLTTLSSLRLFGICVSSCPKVGDFVCTDAADAVVSSNTSSVPGATRTDRIEYCMANPSASVCRGVADSCWFTSLSTRSVLFRCLPLYRIERNVTKTCLYPSDAATMDDCETVVEVETRATTRPATDSFVVDKLNQANELWSQWFGDLAKAWPVLLLCGLLCGLVLGFVYLFFMKYCAGVLVWTCVWAVQVAIIGVTIYCYNVAGLITADTFSNLLERYNVTNSVAGMVSSEVGEVFEQDEQTSAQRQRLFKYVAYVFTGLSILCFVLILAMRSRIRLAVAIIKESARAVGSMPGLVFFPFAIVAMLAVLYTYWIVVASFLASAGSVSDFNVSISSNSSLLSAYKALENKPVGKYMLIFHFFGLLWTNQFIQAIGMCTIAGAVSMWYWTPRGSPVDAPIRSSFSRTMRYHLGSLAFGAFLVAVVQFLRAILAYVDQRTKTLQKNNMLVRIVMCCVQCCLYCFEKCLKFISRYGYIFVAMYGDSFFSATVKAVKTIANNVLRVAVVNTVSRFVMLLGKLFVACTCGVLAFIFVSYSPVYKKTGTNPVSSPWLPVLFVMILSYFVTASFFYVYDMAIDTILLCFCKDEELGKAGQSVMAEEELRKVMDDAAQVADAVALARAGKDAAAAAAGPVGKAVAHA